MNGVEALEQKLDKVVNSLTEHTLALREHSAETVLRLDRLEVEQKEIENKLTNLHLEQERQKAKTERHDTIFRRLGDVGWKTLSAVSIAVVFFFWKMGQ